jgi:translation elongation factor EF-G
VLNSTKDRKGAYRPHAADACQHREDIKEANAGDIIALAGLKKRHHRRHAVRPGNPVILERMDFPEPVIEIAIEPKTKADQEKMGVALARLAQEDPSFRVSTDQETGQTIIKGMGELHLDIKVDILKRTYKVEANVGAPQVAYRETISGKKIEIDYTHKKQTGGSGQFARVKLTLRAGEPGGLRVREQDRRRLGAEGIHPGRREGPRSRRATPACSPASRHRLQGHADRRRLPRRRLVGAGLRNRGARRLQGRPARRPGRSCSSRS